MKLAVCLIFAVTVSALIIAGCASTQKAEKSLDSLKDTREELAEGKKSIENANADLNSLLAPKNADLKTPYEELISELESIEKRGSKVRSLVEELDKNRDRYFQEWEKELSSFQSQELKQISEQRLQETRAKFNPVNTALDQADRLFQPYVADLQDIRRYLDLDLNAKSVQAISDRISRAVQSGAALKGAVDEVIRSIDQVTVVLSPKQ